MLMKTLALLIVKMLLVSKMIMIMMISAFDHHDDGDDQHDDGDDQDDDGVDDK